MDAPPCSEVGVRCFDVRLFAIVRFELRYVRTVRADMKLLTTEQKHADVQYIHSTVVLELLSPSQKVVRHESR